MDPAATSFLVWQIFNGLGDTPVYEWSRLEVGNTDRFGRPVVVRTGLVPLPRDHECFQHVPRSQDSLQHDDPASRETDRQLMGYSCWFAPQLRILPAGGGSVKYGAVVVHYLGEREERLARIHRFEAPGARVPFVGRDGIPIFHVLGPDLVVRIARHYVATCTVPDASNVGSQLSWVPWRGPAIG